MGDSTSDVSGLTEAVASPHRGNHAVIADSMAEQFLRDGLAIPTPDAQGAWELI